MLDYFNTYKNFIDKKSVKGLTRDEAHKKNLELHHFLPKCKGGTRKDNLVCLTEIDHCIAHILFDIAMVQQGKDPIYGYSVRPVIRSMDDIDWTDYWNPLTKVKVSIKLSGKMKTMTMAEAIKLMCMLKHEDWNICHCRNSAFADLIYVLVRKSGHQRFGYEWKISF